MISRAASFGSRLARARARARGLTLAIALCACARPSLPPPVAPLVPTPDAEFRRNGPPVPALGVIALPELTSARLENGITLMIAVVPGSPYTEVRLLTRHALPRDEADLWAGAVARASLADVKRFPLEMAAGSGSTIVIGWRCQPEQLSEALQAAQIVLRSPPSLADLELAQRGREMRETRKRLSPGAAVEGELRVRLLGADPKPARTNTEAAGAGGPGANDPLLFEPSDSALLIAGAIEPATVQALAELMFAAIQPRTSPNAPALAERELEARPAPHAGKPIVLVKRPVTLAEIGFGFGVPKVSDSKSVDAGLIAGMLAGSSSALLNAGLREKLRLTYGVTARYEIDPRGGLIVGEFEVEEARVPEAIHALRAGFEELRARAQPELFALARERLRVEVASQSGRADAMAAWLTVAFVGRFSPDLKRGMLARLDALDPEALRASAQAMLAHPLFVVAGSSEAGSALERAHEDFEVTR